MSAVALPLTLVVPAVTAQAQTGAKKYPIFEDRRRLPAAAEETAQRASLSDVNALRAETRQSRQQLLAIKQALENEAKAKQKAEAALKQAQQERDAAKAQAERQLQAAKAAEQSATSIRAQYVAKLAERERALAAQQTLAQSSKKEIGKSSESLQKLQRAYAKDVEALKAQIAAIKTERNGIASKLDEAQRDLGEREKELRAAKTEVEGSAQRLTASEQAQRALAEDLKRAKQREATGRAELAQRLNGAETRAAEAEAALAKARQQSATSTQQLQDVRRQMATLVRAQALEAQRRKAEEELRAAKAREVALLKQQAAARRATAEEDRQKTRGRSQQREREAQQALLRAAQEKAERQRAERARAEQERIAQEKAEQARKEQQRIAQERDRRRRAAKAASRALAARREAARREAARREAECANPLITAEARPGGRVLLTIRAACHAGKSVRVAYDVAEFERSLGPDGIARVTVDLFAGAAQPATVVLPDGTQRKVELPAGDSESVIKIAVLWRSPVNLDLHALEYAARRSGPGHVWSGAPGDARSASSAAQSAGAGRGFMSQADDGSNAGDHVEVYTLWKPSRARRGLIELNLDFASRGDKPSGDFCGSGRFASVEYVVLRKYPGRPVTREPSALAGLPCDRPITERIRFNRAAIRHLRMSGR